MLAAGGMFLLLPSPATWAPGGPARGSAIPAGEAASLPPPPGSSGATLLVFYSAASALERGAVVRFEHHPALPGGLRRIALDSLQTPAARQYRIRETPTFLLYGRGGELRLRSARPEEVERALGTAGNTPPAPAEPSFPSCPVRSGPRLAWIDESNAKARRVYRRWGGGRQPVPDIYKAMSLRPDLMDRVADLTDRAHFSSGYLNRRTKELIATYVSSLNRCGYCLGSHSENLHAQGASLRQVQSVARGDLEAAALTPKERALLGLVKTVTLTPAGVTDAQIAQLRRLGWRDDQIFEAAFETSLFAFFNRMADVYGLRYEPDF
jgi:uncharacterized peroxidase-related enzyme